MRIPTSLFREGEPLDETREAAYVVTGAIADDIRTHLEATNSQVKRIGIGVAVALVVGLGLLYAGYGAVGLGIVVLAIAGGGVAGWRVLQSEPDVTVVGAQKRYWTGHIVPQPEGAFVYDATGSTATTELEVETFEDMSLLHESVDTFSGELTLPVVQTDDRNVELTIQQRLSETQRQIESAETVRFEAPLADTTGEITRELQALPTDNTRADVETDSIHFDLDTATEQAAQIRETETMAFETDAEETLEELKSNSEDVVQTLSRTTEDAIKRLNDHVDVAGEITSITSYNFYCPNCIQDDIYSELTLGFADGPQWFCETCRGQFDADDEPVPKHRIKDDLVEEIWDRLWIEKDDQRRAIYENIEDQKSDLTEREFEQRQEAIRNAWDRIKDIRSKIRDLETEAKAERGAISEVGKVMEKYERLAKQRRQQFEKDVAEAVDRIEQETQEAIEEMRDYEEQKIEESQQAAKERAELIRAEEQARHKEKMVKLDSIEQTQEELLEHEKKAHEREMLMESQGGTSAIGFMNRFRMAKGKRFGFSKED